MTERGILSNRSSVAHTIFHIFVLHSTSRCEHNQISAAPLPPSRKLVINILVRPSGGGISVQSPSAILKAAMELVGSAAQSTRLILNHKYSSQLFYYHVDPVAPSGRYNSQAGECNALWKK